MSVCLSCFFNLFFFFFNDTATTEIYTLSLHDALPVVRGRHRPAVHPLRRPRRKGHGLVRRTGPGPASVPRAHLAPGALEPAEDRWSQGERRRRRPEAANAQDYPAGDPAG